jgi:hypothetical protein
VIASPSSLRRHWTKMALRRQQERQRPALAGQDRNRAIMAEAQAAIERERGLA